MFYRHVVTLVKKEGWIQKLTMGKHVKKYTPTNQNFDFGV